MQKKKSVLAWPTPTFPALIWAACMGLSTMAIGQPVTQAQADSGWVSLFDGKTFDHFYSSFDGKQSSPLVGKTTDVFGIFTVQNGIIHCTGSNYGYLGTVEKYSHYRFRVDFKYTNNGDLNQNGGVIYHVVESASRYNVTWPRSIECQGQKRGMGELLTIVDVWITTTVENSDARPRKYKEGGVRVDHGAATGIQCLGSSNPFKDGQWNTLEIEVRGSDSAVHIANGQVVLKAWKLRSAANDKPADFSQLWGVGSIGIQSEKADIAYRNVQIMELDSVTGLPINGQPTSAKSIANPRPNSPVQHGIRLFRIWDLLGRFFPG